MSAVYHAKNWSEEEDGLATAEFVLVFPLMFTLILGVWDIGNGILANQKAIMAANTVVDLIGREEAVDDDELAMAFQAGEQAMRPFPTVDLVIDVASVEYDGDDVPQVVWQETNGGGGGDASLPGRTAGLGVSGGGAIAVQVTYGYKPLFAGFVINNFNMQERVFSRGRRSAIVTRE